LANFISKILTDEQDTSLHHPAKIRRLFRFLPTVTKMSNQIGVLFLPQISALAARQPVFALFWGEIISK
jgi:hypothetical protein